MKTVAALREQRASKLDACKAITDKASTENRDLNDQEQSAFEAGRGEVERIDRDIRNAEFLADCERRAPAEPVRPGAGHDLSELERRFQIGKALSEFSEGRLTGVEAEWAAEHRSGRPGAMAMPASAFLGERRVGQNVSSGPDGGFLVSTQIGPVADRFRPRLAIEAMGATVMSGLTGPLDLPRVTESGAASWVGEGGAPNRSDMALGMVSMTPRTVAAEYAMTRRAMLQAPQLESVIRRDIGLLLAQAMDAAAINGNGVGKPLGILQSSQTIVLPLGADGAAPTIDLATDLIGAIETLDVTGDMAFLTNAKVKRTMLKLKDGESRPWALADLFKGERVEFSSQVPSDLTKGSGTALSAIIYGMWADLVLGYWSSVDILLNPYHSDVASSGGVLLHAFLDVDTAIRRSGSFAACKDVVTA